MPPIPCAGKSLSLDLGPALFVKCRLSPVSLRLASPGTSPSGSSQQILSVLQSGACPAWLLAAFQQGTLVPSPKTGTVEVLYLALSEGKGGDRGGWGAMELGMLWERRSLVLGSVNAAAGNAE